MNTKNKNIYKMKKEYFYYGEIAGIIFALLGFFLQIGQISFGSFLMIGGLSGIFGHYINAMVQLQTKNYDFLAENVSKTLVAVVYGIITFGIFGLILKLTFAQGGHDILKIASYAHLALVIMLLFALRIADNAIQFENTKSLLIRALIMLAVVYMFFLTPENRLKKLFDQKANTTQQK